MLNTFFFIALTFFAVLWVNQCIVTFKYVHELSQTVSTNEQSPRLTKLATALKVGFAAFVFLVIFHFLQDKTAIYQYHFASVVLVYVGFSASLKASQAQKQNERKVGLFLAAIAYIGVVTLLLLQPGNVLL